MQLYSQTNYAYLLVWIYGNGYICGTTYRQRFQYLFIYMHRILKLLLKDMPIVFIVFMFLVLRYNERVRRCCYCMARIVGSSVKIMLSANDLCESLFQIFSVKMSNALINDVKFIQKHVDVAHYVCAVYHSKPFVFSDVTTVALFGPEYRQLRLFD